MHIAVAAILILGMVLGLVRGPAALLWGYPVQGIVSLVSALICGLVLWSEWRAERC